MKTLLLIPSFAKSGIEGEVAADRHPRMDYDALASALQTEGKVELLDYGAVKSARNVLVRVARRLVGVNFALALMGFLRRKECDALFTNAENVALPLALMLRLARKRPRHVTIAHRLSAKKKRSLYRWLKLHRQMDVVFVYSAAQREYGKTVLGIPEETLRLIPFHADHRFYRPLKSTPIANQICSAGLEWRDYPTLIEAVKDRPDLRVRLAAASPWSKHTSEVDARVLPAHVEARRYDYLELRTLYAESAFVVVPLYENDFQAGVTTLLEAMSTGKAVIVTGTIGQTDVIAHEQNGLYVAPGGVHAWAEAIERLRTDHLLCARLGKNARRWIEDNATLDHWVAQMTAGLRGELAFESAAVDEDAGSRSGIVPRESTLTRKGHAELRGLAKA